jgi:hypothetical protein
VSTPIRSTWTTDSIRAVDLADNDTVLIDGVWREVLDVWNDDDDPAAQFGDDHWMTILIDAKVSWCSPSWTAVRYVHEETSTAVEIDSRLHFFRCRELVTVQREIPAENPLTGPLSVLAPLDLLGALRAGVELYGEYGDDNDVLSAAQVEQLSTLAEHFGNQ